MRPFFFCYDYNLSIMGNLKVIKQNKSISLERYGSIMTSIWSLDTKLPQMKTLKENKTTEVVVIGAGMAGLLIAYFLKKENIDTIVLEGNKIASGQTMNTTAKITSQHNLIYDTLISKLGIETAKGYATANEKAIEIYAEIINKEKLDCNFRRESAYVYSLDNASKIEKEVEAANKAGIKAEFTTKTTLPFDVMASIRFHNQASFNPLDFLNGIIKDLEIYENTMVQDIEDNRVITDNATITAKHIVVASHYPIINFPGYYFLRMHQERSYVIALENAAKLDGMYIDEAESGYSFRNYNDKLILGGPGHRTGKNKYGGYYDKLTSAAADFYPNSKEICRWSAQDCVTIDNVPYIGRYASSTPNLYVATGFKKWGMTSSMVSAMLISDLIRGKKNPYEEVFDPQRFKISASMKTLNEEVKESTKGLIVERLKIPNITLEGIEKGHGEIIEFNGIKLGVYKDKHGEIYTVSPKCTHLGCELTWNQDELSWDCPCHGSRFDYEGKLINNPALKGIEIE